MQIANLYGKRVETFLQAMEERLPEPATVPGDDPRTPLVPDMAIMLIDGDTVKCTALPCALDTREKLQVSARTPRSVVWNERHYQAFWPYQWTLVPKKLPQGVYYG